MSVVMVGDSGGSWDGAVMVAESADEGEDEVERGGACAGKAHRSSKSIKGMRSDVVGSSLVGLSGQRS